MFKKIEFLANLSIIVVALLLGAVLVKRNLTPTPQQAALPAKSKIQPGTKLQLPNINWAQSEQTLLLALSDTCRFCTESAPFYQRLARQKTEPDSPRLVAVLPQDVNQGQAYLDNLGVKVDEVKQSALSAIGVSGTPTLIMVDRDGVVKESWVGKLPPALEAEVLSRLRAARAGR